MTSSGQRYLRLPQQVAQLLVERIKKGHWSTALPNERHLASELNVSRRTLRDAIAELRRAGWLKTAGGQGTTIVRRMRSGGRKANDASVGLILPYTMANLRHHTSLWIDALRTILFDSGYRLEVHHSKAMLTVHAGRMVQRIVSQCHHRAWLLSFSSRAAQEWFVRQGVPCVIAGACHREVRLPSIDTDNRAVCRHAAIRMAGQSHRQIAFLTEQSNRAGDEESVRGFREGAQFFQDRGLLAEVVTYRRDTAHVAQVVTSLLGRKVRPTALLVSNPDYFLTVICIAGQLGLRIPEDLSLLCRDDDHCLHYL